MKQNVLIIAAFFTLASCGAGFCGESSRDAAKVLAIEWQRLVDKDGKTCDRCGDTEKELRSGVASLKRALKPLGIKVTFEKKSMGPDCAKSIIDSNRILMAGRPLEEWLGATVGTSPCGSCCAKLGEKVECRTTTMDKKTYEVIPAELIVKAGLKAASEILGAPPSGSCCPPGKPAAKKDAACCG